MIQFTSVCTCECVSLYVHLHIINLFIYLSHYVYRISACINMKLTEILSTINIMMVCRSFHSDIETDLTRETVCTGH